MTYIYYCKRCQQEFEVDKSMRESMRIENCPICGEEAERRYVPLAFTFGFRLSDESHLVGYPDEFVRNI